MKLRDYQGLNYNRCIHRLFITRQCTHKWRRQIESRNSNNHNKKSLNSNSNISSRMDRFKGTKLSKKNKNSKRIHWRRAGIHISSLRTVSRKHRSKHINSGRPPASTAARNKSNLNTSRTTMWMSKRMMETG
jgi:hypothetical protein